MRTMFGIIGSLLIHIIMAVFVIVHPIAKISEPIPKLVPEPIFFTDISIRKYTESDDTEKNNDDSTADTSITEDVCSETYTGVGFIVNGSTGIIFSVPITLPAYKAGIRVGDIHVTTSVDGDLITIYTLRNGVELNYTIPGEQICLDSL